MRIGFQDDQDIPGMLRSAVGMSPELQLDPEQAYYFLPRIAVEHGPAPGMANWRKRLFIGLSHNAASPAANFHLPVDRTVVMGSTIAL